MRIIVTGASGFVGRPLCKRLIKDHHEVTVIDRDQVDIEAIQGRDFDVLIHLAGRAHVLHDTASDIYQAYADVNINYTQKIAELARALNVRRFIFLSSIKVNGESTLEPITENDVENPLDAYAETKLIAENNLKSFFMDSNTELLIIRPPLVYGPDVKANFKNLIAISQKMLPLPLGAINNKRSLVYIENLIDFIIVCMTHPKAVNETFLISDDYDVSITELLITLAKQGGRRSFLIPIPQSWLKMSFKLLGKESLYSRLCGDLQVDVTKARSILGWKPRFSFEQSIKNTLKAESEQ